MGLVENLQMHLVKQVFSDAHVADIPAAVKDELAKINLAAQIKPGMKVAITAGSRGINNIVPILKTVVAEVKRCGGVPFVVAAMGSHGGGTVEGQLEILHSLGITEEAVDAPVIASDKVVEIGRTAAGMPVYMDDNASRADGIIVVNRVKKHTSITGEIESGLMKMMVIGLGKHYLANSIHKFGPTKMRDLLLEMGRAVIANTPILCGLGIVENCYDQTAIIEGFLPGDLEEGEKRLLREAKSLMPKLPFDNIDLLIVDEMGKNYSGTGMDNNILGRVRLQGEPELPAPFIYRVVVLDLSEASHGNAMGIGLADFTTKTLADKIDWKKTYLNGFTSTNVQRVMLPMVLENDYEAIETALKSFVPAHRSGPRVVRIKNTLNLEEILVSDAYLEDVMERANLEIVSQGLRLTFDANLRLDRQIWHNS